MNKVYEENLRELYEIRGMPMHEVAKELGVAVGTIYNYLRKYDIQRRPPHKGMKGKHHSPEVIAIISATHKGKVVSEETKKKMAEVKKNGGIGHKKKRGDGYIYVYFPEHPKSTSDGYIMEHVLVMECLIGRWLNDDEVVHHKNKIRDDNRKENLQLMTFKEHAGFHMKERYATKKGGMTY